MSTIPHIKELWKENVLASNCCPECAGTGNEVLDNIMNGDGTITIVMINRDCPICNGKGRLPIGYKNIYLNIAKNYDKQ